MSVGRGSRGRGTDVCNPTRPWDDAIWEISEKMFTGWDRTLYATGRWFLAGLALTGPGKGQMRSVGTFFLRSGVILTVESRESC